MDEGVVVVNILVGGNISEAGILYKGDIICKVNEKKIKNLKEFRKNYNNKKTILKLETTSKKLMVISKKDLMNDDEIIRKNFNYESSKLFKQLK